jgi:hypothetical protein
MQHSKGSADAPLEVVFCNPFQYYKIRLNSSSTKFHSPMPQYHGVVI